MSVRDQEAQTGANRLRTSIIPAVVAAALLLTVVGHAAANTATASANQTQWAYGGEGSFDYVVNPTANVPMYLDLHVWGITETILTQVNTSSTTVALEIQRAFVGSMFMTMCQPSCNNSGNSPSTMVNETFNGWASETIFANLTTQATVSLDGASVQALGLEDSSVRSSGNVTITANESLPVATMNGNSTNANVSVYMSSQVNNGFAQESFSPALGILPTDANLTLGSVWSSSSQYTASASGSVPYHYYFDYPAVLGLLPQSGTGTAPVTMPSSGTETLDGGFLHSFDLDGWGGVTFVISLYLDYAGGPFDALEGMILVPQALDLFGPGLASDLTGGSSNSSSSPPGMMNASTGQTDYTQTLAEGHIGIMGSQTDTGGSENGASSASISMSFGPLLSFPSSVSSPSHGTQNQPQNVDQARGDAQSHGVSLPAASKDLGSNGGGNGSQSTDMTIYLGIGLVVVVAMAVLALVLVRSRRRKSAAAHPPCRTVATPANQAWTAQDSNRNRPPPSTAPPTGSSTKGRVFPKAYP